MRLGAEQRLVDQRPRSERLGRVVEALFSACAALLPCTIGSCLASSAAVGVRMSPSPRPFRSSCSYSRSFVCSAVSSWSSWTGVEVCVTGIVSPSSSVGALGVPGFRSTKKLPSRKIRERIFGGRVPWIGRPLVVDRHRDLDHVRALVALDLGHLADVDSGDPHGRVEPQVVRGLEDGVELERLLPGQGLRERQVEANTIRIRIVSAPARPPDPALEAAGNDALCGGVLEASIASSFCGWSSVTVPWLPGTLPIACLPLA